ncbi:peptidoglycan DD-metalloendopeptidase family protein [Pedobacter sp. HMF7647]|uniref:Peptidoglycan DD-metalloendopeptidase family protein n=1 Tax=Hufsiella arboris TaxID=2695275 RepID=A0A7K1YAY5_9SPHI|nr:peptidoglycan DD-metalloendopeptidase family protein [Hufsiella arboris]MXV51743.1 peptidoglycan DD-metalloendopeptidase family protein [Hufsiella arboris]
MRFVRLFIFVFIFLSGGKLFAQSSSELKRQKEALTREIEMLNSSLKQTSSSKRLSLKQINVLEAQIRLREQKIGTINSEIRLLNNQISDNTSTVHSLQSQLEKLKKEYAGMVLFAFRNQSAYSKLMFIFAAQDFNQAYKRLKYLQQFGDYRRKQAQYILGTQKDLNIKIVELDQNKRQKSNLLSEEEKEKTTLGGEKNNKAKELGKLAKEEKQLKREISKKQQQAARLNSAIRAAINREILAAKRKAEQEAREAAARAKAENPSAPAPAPKTVSNTSSVLAATPEALKLSSDFLSNRGRLPWPVSNGVIVEGFGPHRQGVNVMINNDGIDIKTAEGASVRAVFSGDVTRVMDVGGSYAVLIRHGEYFTVYSNLKSVNVSNGQKVSVKQAIGSVITDSSDGTTLLHFEVRKGADPMNPSSWLAN